VVPPRAKRDYLASFSSVSIISTLRHSSYSCRRVCVCAYTHTYASLLSHLARSFTPRLFLSFIFIHRLPTRPSTSVLSSTLAVHSCAARRSAEVSVGAFHSRSLVLSLSFVGRDTLLCVGRSLARSRSFLPLPRPSTHPLHASLSVSSVPFASFSNLRRQCCMYSGNAQRARRARNTRRGHVDSLRSLARSPRLALLRFACGASSSSAAWRGAERPVLLLLLLLIAGRRGVVNCAGRGRPRAHVSDVIFRLVKSRNNRASGGAYVRVCVCVRARVCIRARYEFACGDRVLRIRSERWCSERVRKKERKRKRECATHASKSSQGTFASARWRNCTTGLSSSNVSRWIFRASASSSNSHSLRIRPSRRTPSIIAIEWEQRNPERKRM